MAMLTVKGVNAYLEQMGLVDKIYKTDSGIYWDAECPLGMHSISKICDKVNDLSLHDYFMLVINERIKYNLHEDLEQLKG